MDVKSLVVFGASGFTGRALTVRAAERGITVRAMSRRIQEVPPSLADRVSTIPIDPDGSHFERAFDGGVDVAVHLAAPAGIVDATSVRTATDACVVSFIEMLNAAVAAGCRRLIYAGSYWQYTPDGTRPAATTLYSALKNAMDEIAGFYARKIDIIDLVLFDSYGPNDGRGKIFSIVDAAARTGRPLNLTGGEQSFVPVHVFDVVEAFLAAAAAEEKIGLRRYWVAGPFRPTLREAVEIYCRIMEIHPDLRWGARPYPEHQIFHPHIGEPVPGWSPSVDFETGVHELREHRTSCH